MLHVPCPCTAASCQLLGVCRSREQSVIHRTRSGVMRNPLLCTPMNNSCRMLHRAPLMLYATPAHAVRDMHHVSNYPSITKEPVRFGSIGRGNPPATPQVCPSVHLEKNPATLSGNPVPSRRTKDLWMIEECANGRCHQVTSRGRRQRCRHHHPSAS